MLRVLLAILSGVTCGAALATPFRGVPVDVIFLDGVEDFQAIETSASALTVTEGAGVSLGVRLASEPPGNVSVVVASSDTGAVTVSESILVFTPADYATVRPVGVFGVEDADFLDETVAVTLSSAGFLGRIVAVAVADDEVAAILTVDRTGNGFGSVASLDGAINCPPTCASTYAAGAMVILTATADTTPLANVSDFTGWSGACASTGSCTVAMAGPQQLGANFSLRPNIAFVTSTTQTASVGGIGSADALCQSLATSSGIPGNFRAYLSTTTVNAISRLGAASGWARADGKPLANSAADFAAGRLFHPLRITNSGVDVGDTVALTASVNGVLSQGTCSDYTSTIGVIGRGSTAAQGSMASSFGTTQCASTQSRWYCLGVDRTAVVQPVPPPARRLAFVTATSWTPGGGLASADALCQGEAAGAGLPGTYRALLATTTASATSRFNANGPPWVRVDGVPVTVTAPEIFSATYWDTSPAVTANGSQYLGNFGVWGGASSVTAVGVAASTCNNWSSNSAAATGYGGRAGYSWVPGFFALDTSNACNATFIRLACLQQ